MRSAWLRSGVGSFSIETAISCWSDENRRILGVPDDWPPNLSTFIHCVHPKDRDKVLEGARTKGSTSRSGRRDSASAVGGHLKKVEFPFSSQAVGQHSPGLPKALYVSPCILGIQDFRILLTFTPRREENCSGSKRFEEQPAPGPVANPKRGAAVGVPNAGSQGRSGRFGRRASR
jgi:hypothetical protein